MPYIKKERKDHFYVVLDDLKEDMQKIEDLSAGDLNYLITSTIKAYVEVKGKRYQTLNDAIGALEGAKLELYRREVAPYENAKLAENGDVF